MAFEVFAASLMHESHSFCVNKAGHAAFSGTGYYGHRLAGAAIGAAFAGTNTEWGGVIAAAERHGWRLTTGFSATAVPAGPVEAAVFEEFADAICAALRAAPRPDGVILILHGAMVTEHLDDPEGALLARVRAILGPDRPLAITLDLHANISKAMVGLADIVTCYRTTPHTDMAATATRAADLLHRAMRGEVRPRTVMARRPFMGGLDDGRTVGAGPFPRLLARAAQLEGEPGVLTIACASGFEWSDVAEPGTAIAVTTDGWRARGIEIAEALADQAWADRHERSIRLEPLDHVAGLARERLMRDGNGPLLIGDYTDCPHGGPAGDGTALLASLIDGACTGAVLGFLNDADAVALARGAGVGARIDLRLGGRVDPRFGGGPLDVSATVLGLTDGAYLHRGPLAHGTAGTVGAGALLEVAGVRVCVVGQPIAVYDREQFRCFAIDPERERVLACKAMNHFRADFEAIAERLVYVDSGGACSYDLARFPWRRVPRPIAPLDFA
jgi:microcystin degradation protein MlrC